MDAKDLKKTILVVDDDPDFLMQLQLQLKVAGFNVVSAESLREAEEVLLGCRPDLVITDLNMESPDAGLVLCHRVKEKAPATPVVLVTAVAYDTAMKSQARLEEQGWERADAILAKPVRAEQLKRELGRLLA